MATARCVCVFFNTYSTTIRVHHIYIYTYSILFVVFVFLSFFVFDLLWCSPFWVLFSYSIFHITHRFLFIFLIFSQRLTVSDVPPLGEMLPYVITRFVHCALALMVEPPLLGGFVFAFAFALLCFAVPYHYYPSLSFVQTGLSNEDMMIHNLSQVLDEERAARRAAEEENVRLQAESDGKGPFMGAS